MKERFRSYVWRCLSCGEETATKRRQCRCGKVCVVQRAPALLANLIMGAGLPDPLCEYEFHPERRWRLDWAFFAPTRHGAVSKRLAIEIDGGTYAYTRGKRSGHGTVKGKLNDAAKRNEAQILGWKVLVFTPQQITSGAFLDVLKRAWEAC